MNNIDMQQTEKHCSNYNKKKKTRFCLQKPGAIIYKMQNLMVLVTNHIIINSNVLSLIQFK